MRIIGIDIGTTSVCAVVPDGESGAVLETVNTENGAHVKAGAPWERLQDPEIILRRVFAIAARLEKGFAPVAGIGLSGQMHGILYLDGEGKAVSPLYTWQDGRGDRMAQDGMTYTQRLAALTGYKLATGYGAVTHFYNHENGLVPERAAGFCTIHDYAALSLAGEKRPLTHVSDAASIGLFDTQRGTFDEAAIERAGMDPALFPAVTRECPIFGRTRSGIPVAVAIGDNQASFAGSVADDASSVLVNIGTGSQISLYSPDPIPSGPLEIRPFTRDGYLLVGSSLCGGRAYALLEEFFRAVAESAGFACESMYPAMNRLSERFETLQNGLKVETQFCGTRENPMARGSIHNLGIDNFTPEHFAAGVLRGIVDELYAQYRAGIGVKGGASVLIGSGNGVRKNPAMQRMLERRFGMKLRIPLHREEAAYGAALFALVASGVCGDLDCARRIIRYA